jgi:predicted ribosome quality control (RQC) complex YloA/Tae2 family protein
MSNPTDELTQLKSRIELYEKELGDITQKITDLLNESTLTSNAEEVAKIYGIAILQYQKLVKAYKEYIDSVERNI